MNFCDECKNLVYQFDIEGEEKAFCILRNEEIENEASNGCSQYEEYPF